MATRRKKKQEAEEQKQSIQKVKEEEEVDDGGNDPDQDILIVQPPRKPAAEDDETLPDATPTGDLEAFFKSLMVNFVIKFLNNDWTVSEPYVFTEANGAGKNKMTKDDAVRIDVFLASMKFGYFIEGDFGGREIVSFGTLKSRPRVARGYGYSITIDFTINGQKKRGDFHKEIISLIKYLEQFGSNLLPPRGSNDGFRLWFHDQIEGLYLAQLGYRSLMKLKVVDNIYKKSDFEAMEINNEFKMILDRVETGQGVMLRGLNSTGLSNLSPARIVLIKQAISSLIEDTVGQAEVKKQIAKIIKQSLLGLTPTSGVPYNFAFYGPPGVGKTRIATILAQVFAALAVIPKPSDEVYRVVNSRTELFRRREVGNGQPETPGAKWVDPIEKPIVLTKKEDLTGAYAGWTDQVTLMAAAHAFGRMLFVDEAYRLGEEGGFGKEALNTLLAVMTESGKYMGVIIAGYQDKIDRFFFGMNPGLKSRFINIINFESYKGAELGVAFIRRMYGKENPNRGFLALDTDTEFTEMKNFFSEEDVMMAFADENIRGVENLAQQVQLEVISTLSFDDISKRLETRSGLPIKIPIDTIRATFKKMDFRKREQFDSEPTTNMPTAIASAGKIKKQTVGKCIRCKMYEAKIECETCHKKVWCTEFCKAFDFKSHMTEHAKEKKGLK